MGYDHGDSFPFNFEPKIEFHLVQNRKENCHHDHIPFNVKEIGFIVFSVWDSAIREEENLLIIKYLHPLSVRLKGTCDRWGRNLTENKNKLLVIMHLQSVVWDSTSVTRKTCWENKYLLRPPQTMNIYWQNRLSKKLLDISCSQVLMLDARLWCVLASVTTVAVASQGVCSQPLWQ